MQPLAWLHPYEAPNGKGGTTFCTTMGASVDLVSEDLRRLVVNACYPCRARRRKKPAWATSILSILPSTALFGTKSFGLVRTCNKPTMVWARPPTLPSLRVRPSGLGETVLQNNPFVTAQVDLAERLVEGVGDKPDGEAYRKGDQ